MGVRASTHGGGGGMGQQTVILSTFQQCRALEGAGIILQGAMMSGFEIIRRILTSCQTSSVQFKALRCPQIAMQSRPAPYGGGGGWHKASVFGCLTLAVPIGLSPLHILTLCWSERVLVVSMEPLDDLSCLTPGSAVLETGYCPCR